MGVTREGQARPPEACDGWTVRVGTRGETTRERMASTFYTPRMWYPPST